MSLQNSVVISFIPKFCYCSFVIFLSALQLMALAFMALELSCSKMSDFFFTSQNLYLCKKILKLLLVILLEALLNDYWCGGGLWKNYSLARRKKRRKDKSEVRDCTIRLVAVICLFFFFIWHIKIHFFQSNCNYLPEYCSIFWMKRQTFASTNML